MFSPSSFSLSASAGAPNSLGLRRKSTFPMVDAPRQSHMIDPQELSRLLVRQRVVNMFRRYVPTKMHRLDIALLRYHGREEILLRSLVAKFGPEPVFSLEQQQLSDALNRTLRAANGQQQQQPPTHTGGHSSSSTGAVSQYHTHRNVAGLSLHSTPAGDLDSMSDTDDDSPPRGASSSLTLSPGRARFGGGNGSLQVQSSPRCRTTSPGAAPLSAPPSGNTIHEAFPAAVALVAYHHQLRSRLFETYTTKRSVIRLQEEKDRDVLIRIAASEFRQITSQLTRKQAEALMLAQREKAMSTEMQLAHRRVEENRIAWLNTQANNLLQKCLVKREDVMSEERVERRTLAKSFSDDIVRLFRHERRIIRLREAAEAEARKAAAATTTQVGGGWQQRERLEEALSSSNSNIDVMDHEGGKQHQNGKRLAGGSRKGHTNGPKELVSPEIALFQNFGVSVSYSIGSERAGGLSAGQIELVGAAGEAVGETTTTVKLPRIAVANTGSTSRKHNHGSSKHPR